MSEVSEAHSSEFLHVAIVLKIEPGPHGLFAWCKSATGQIFVVDLSLESPELNKGEDFQVNDIVVLSGLFYSSSSSWLVTSWGDVSWKALCIRRFSPDDEANPFLAFQKKRLFDLLIQRNLHVAIVSKIELGPHGFFAWCKSAERVFTVDLSLESSKWEGEGEFPLAADLVVLSGIYYHYTGTNYLGESKGGWRALHMRHFSLVDEYNSFLEFQKKRLLDLLNRENLERKAQNLCLNSSL